MREAFQIQTLWPVVWHTVCAALFVAGVAAFALFIAHDNREWPVPGMGWRLGVVASIGIACAFPWVALTWLAHQVTRPYWAKAAAEKQAPQIPTPPERANEKVKSLLTVWEHITLIALAFAVFVGIAIIPSGVLRNLWLSQTGGGSNAKALEASFPAADVLAYGAFFGLLVGVLVIPLVASWRAAAKQVVDEIYSADPGYSGKR